MSASVRIKLEIPELWSARDSLVMSSDTIALVRIRTYQGKDTADKSFKKYSRSPLYISKRGARLQPKGGRVARGGRSVYYAEGYWQYKHQSRRRQGGGASQTAEVDLTLSGALLNNIVTTSATKHGYTVGLSNAVRHYGYTVNDDRPFIGLSPKDRRTLTDAVAARIRTKLR